MSVPAILLDFSDKEFEKILRSKKYEVSEKATDYLRLKVDGDEKHGKPANWRLKSKVDKLEDDIKNGISTGLLDKNPDIFFKTHRDQAYWEIAKALAIHTEEYDKLRTSRHPFNVPQIGLKYRR